jgi:hypothetical protein
MGRKVWVPTVSGPLAPCAAGFVSWLTSRAYSASGTPNVLLLRAKASHRNDGAMAHESTQTTHIYEHADPALKEQAIARTAPLLVCCARNPLKI